MAKAQYIGVGGVARRVKQPYVGVSGVARKVKSGYVGVSGVARQFFQGGVPASSLAVGSSVYLKENGTNVEYLVVHQGNPSTSLYDASCNGTWLLRKAIYKKLVFSRSYNNLYAESSLHSYLNSTFLNLFESSIQSLVKQVKIPYNNASGSSGSVSSGSSGLLTKVFLLSAYEVGIYGVDYNNIVQDGNKLDYFSSSSRRVAYLDGIDTAWWLRTAAPYSTNVCVVSWTGGEVSSTYTVNSYGVRPALILPSAALFNPDTLEFVSA